VQKLLEIDPQARVIVSSGYSDDPVLSNFRKFGFQGLIYKPYKIKELDEAVTRVMCGRND
jgi:two-component system cell cycle sensor histidine kinase/response regulator CckA